ncbi:MAG: response regulator [Prochlorothrix sp.]
MMKPCTSILVVDDEPLNYEVIEEFLSTEDYELHYVPNGIDALNSIGKIYAPDLILLDFMMPGLDGVEVCRRLRATPEWKMVPIIMVTALNGKEDLARCLNAGADDFISKPLHRLELVSRIQAMLRLKYQYDEVKKLSHLQQDTIQFLERSLAQIHGNLGSTLSHEMVTIQGVTEECGFQALKILDWYGLSCFGLRSKG